MTGRNDRDRRRDEAFVRDVMARTSGSPCTRAEDQLPALADGELAGMDLQLVQAHLEHCAGCRRLAVVLGWLGPELPNLAEIDPGPEFTARVLGATSRRRRVVLDVAERPTGLAGLMDRVGRWWDERILRPAFATQVAYVATVVLVLLTAVPGAPLRGAPGKALETVSAGPQGLPLVGPATVAAGAWADARMEDLAGSARARRDRWLAGLAERNVRSAPARDYVGVQLDEAWDDVRAGSLGEAGYALMNAAGGVRDTWKLWWRAPAPPEDSNEERERP